MISQKKILIVEDNIINRMMLSEILSPQYQILEAENGQEALAVLDRQKDDISLILLDIVMPVMDGYTFLSAMKADAAYSSIPVIVTTQNDGESDEVAALSHGATDFVAKPYKPQVILHRVASIINLRESAAMINQFQYDRLTGLYSKEFFYQRARDLLVQSPEKDFDIICSDIENFKLVNDTFGNPAGDSLLCGVAQMYTRYTADWGICGRLNADQFVCLLEHRREYTDELFIQAGAQVSISSVSKNIVMKWGIYAVEDKSIPVEQMCDRALLAARSIKGQYGKYFAYYDNTLRDKLLREQAIADSMEEALAERQFVIHLQPKYRIDDYKLSGAEALVRWNHPEWGIQSPAEFIPLFEKNGFITKLDLFVWESACSVLRQWDDQGLAPISISVNVSRADIYNEDIAKTLLHLIKKYGVEPWRLHLEITESAYTENPNQIIDTVTQLRDLGFIVEMDDFGTGYSSLNMLNRMPLDILKLDMKFIQSETAKPVNQGILRFIMSLARWMDLGVVAEGVETEEQLERLREMGCDFVQGYYLGRPMPCGELAALLKEQETVAQGLSSRGLEQKGRKNRVIILGDEDEEYRAVTRKVFESRFEVIEACDMAGVRSCIAEYGNKTAAVLLSLSLPKSEGKSIMEIVQREKVIWNTPVIVTAPWDEKLEEKILEQGADDFAGKPHSPRSVYKRVLRAVRMAASQERELILEKEAYQDYLTGLLNRWGLRASIESLGRGDGMLAVYLLDLDNLKQVNDTFGHAEGDWLIQQFAMLLRAHFRRTDILSRYGGDEFVVVMRQMETEEDALHKGREVCRAVQGKEFYDKIPASCTAGVATCQPGISLDEMINRADQALYFAKASEKGGCCLWSVDCTGERLYNGNVPEGEGNERV